MASSKRKYDWQEPLPFTGSNASSCSRPVKQVAASTQSWMTPSHCKAESSLQPGWMNPLVCNFAKESSGFSDAPMPEIRLTIGELLLACKPECIRQDQDPWFKGNGPAELRSMLLKPCPFARSSTSKCSVCEGGLEPHDVITFRSMWNQMDRDTRSHYLHALHQREVDPTNVNRVRWVFLGKRVCIERLLQLLGTSKRAYYRQVWFEKICQST